MTQALRSKRRSCDFLSLSSEQSFGEHQKEISQVKDAQLKFMELKSNINIQICNESQSLLNCTNKENMHMSKSPYEKIIHKLQQDEQINKPCNLFYDTEFSAGIISLMGNSTKESKELLIKKQWDNITWRRSTQFMTEGNSLFGEKGIQSHSIKQGTLRNCYLLSTLACLAQKPERIINIFKSREINRYGCYCITLCVNGQWKEVIIDDLFPVSKSTGKVLFQGKSQQDLWILLVEKAWAKINGGFIYLDMGRMRETLHDLTGAPCDNYFLENENEQEIWDVIYEGIQKGYCITCGTKSAQQNNYAQKDARSQDNTLNSMGLVSSHAYSLLGAYVLPDSSKTKIIKLRNPWGIDKWKGKYSERDEDSWMNVDRQFKKRIGYEKYLQDEGIIYMELKDFYANFVDLQICMINDSYKYSSYKSKQETKKSYFYKIKIAESGQYFITVNQQSQLESSRDILKQNTAMASNSDYSNVTLVLARWEPKYRRYVYVDGNQDNYREVYTKQSKQTYLKEGEYVLYVKVNWTGERESDKLVISCYGVSSVSIQQIKRIQHFIRSVLLYHAMFLSRNKKCLLQHNQEHFWICMDHMSEGYIYIAAWNNVKKVAATNRVSHRKNKSINIMESQNNLTSNQFYLQNQNQSQFVLNSNEEASNKIQIFNSQFKIQNMDGLKLKKPFKDGLVNFSLKPGQADIALIRCKDMELIESFDVDQKFIF